MIRGAAALRAANLPMIEAVGAAAAEAPRLLDLAWGRADAPKVTLVGKGVCFDTGGLDIKPAASMGLMKKDMGGAATAMGLAEMVMGLGLDLRLRLLVPAVENAISAPAMRPGDILPSRKGLTVEVNNTDAEGRLVLGDALALADEEAPALIVSLATLTGAARVALGPDLPPFFTDDDGLAADLSRAAAAVADPLWRLPFWDPDEPLIEPGIADLDNAPVRRHGRGDHRGAVPAPLRHRQPLSAPRHLRLDPQGHARPPQGRCVPGGAGASRTAGDPILWSDLTIFAGRLTPARPDLAADHLRGRVEAARFVPGQLRRVTASLLDLTAVPDPGRSRHDHREEARLLALLSALGRVGPVDRQPDIGNGRPARRVPQLRRAGEVPDQEDLVQARHQPTSLVAGVTGPEGAATAAPLGANFRRPSTTRIVRKRSTDSLSFNCRSYSRSTVGVARTWSRR